MKKKNVKIGLVVQYKGGDPEEHTFKDGDTGTIVRIERDNIHSNYITVKNSKNGSHSYFKPKYLSIVKVDELDRIPESTMHGVTNEKVVLATQLLVLPATNEYFSAANKMVRKFSEDDVCATEMLPLWSHFLFRGGLDKGEFRKRQTLILNYIAKHEL